MHAETHTASKAERAAYIRQAAIARGMDPETALRVAQSEGFNKYVGDQGRSFGDWQLFTGGGVGNRALAAGINVRDPSTHKRQTDFALDVAKREGWSQWHGARRVGIGDWQGINRGRRPQVPPPAPAMPAVPAPPAAELGSGRAGLNDAADKIQAAAEMFKDSGFHGQIQLAVTGSGRDQVRVAGIKAQGRGAVSADMGVSMPRAKESDGDWV